MPKPIQGFLVYRIFFGDTLVYVGRTKQSLQNRIRGHLFGKPMHRKIAIEQVTKIEYAEFQTEADMNLYEIFFILKEHPPLNVDDKTADYPTVTLPDVEWHVFRTPLWKKWCQQISDTTTEYEKRLKRFREIPEEMTVLRAAKRIGDIPEDVFYAQYDALKEELVQLRNALWK